MASLQATPGFPCCQFEGDTRGWQLDSRVSKMEVELFFARAFKRNAVVALLERSGVRGLGDT